MSALHPGNEELWQKGDIRRLVLAAYLGEVEYAIYSRHRHYNADKDIWVWNSNRLTTVSNWARWQTGARKVDSGA